MGERFFSLNLRTVLSARPPVESVAITAAKPTVERTSLKNTTAASCMTLAVLSFVALSIAAPNSAQASATSKTPPKQQQASDAKKPAPPVDWKKIPETERKVLAPLEKDWAQLPGMQQRKLIGAAKAYPKLVPIQQERFQERIKEWAGLTLEQRRAARDKFQHLSSLPPQKQYELRERWNEKAEKAEKASPNSAATNADSAAK